MSSRKPIDSISSHSSSTASSTCRGRACGDRCGRARGPAYRRRCGRPRAAADLLAHRRAAVEGDDDDAAVRRCRVSSRATCSASSRVGSRITRLHELVLGDDDAVREREAERRGLARAGARLHHQVLALRDQRKRLRLHGHGFGEPHLVDGAHDVGVQAQLGERGAFGKSRGGRVGRDAGGGGTGSEEMGEIGMMGSSVMVD